MLCLLKVYSTTPGVATTGEKLYVNRKHERLRIGYTRPQALIPDEVSGGTGVFDDEGQALIEIRRARPRAR